MAGIRLEFAQFGHFDSFDIIRSLTSMAGLQDHELPAPIATGLTTMYYTDTAITNGQTYYYKARVWRDGISSVTDEEAKVLAGYLWLPNSISKKLWLASDSVVADSSKKIAQLTDKSGNGYNFTQSTGLYKPTLVDGGAFPVIRFDGLDDVVYGTESSKSIFRNTNKYWIFFVFSSAPGGQAEQNLIHSSQASTTAWRAGIRVRESGNIDVLGRVNDSTYFATGFANNHTLQIGFMQVDMQAGQATVFGNGVSGTPLTIVTGSIPNTASINVMSIGGNETNNPIYALKGDLAELIVGTSDITTDERKKVEGWAAYKYGLQMFLPENHPYKNVPPII